MRNVYEEIQDCTQSAIKKQRRAAHTHLSALDEGQITAREPESARTHTPFLCMGCFSLSNPLSCKWYQLYERASVYRQLFCRALALAVFGITPRGMLRRTLTRERAHRMYKKQVK